VLLNNTWFRTVTSNWKGGRGKGKKGKERRAGGRERGKEGK
jgi:hypothetical protein